MAEPFKASVQYDDLKGTVALDGYDGPPLDELAKHTNMPAGYFPVGFHLWRIHPDASGSIPFTIVAVDARGPEVGHSIDNIVKLARSQTELAVYSFEGKMTPEEFGACFKRFDLKAVNKNLAEFNVVAYGTP